LRVAKEQSMLSVDKGEVMVVKMENHKIKEGKSDGLSNLKIMKG
jgi:hypothetical protein